MKPLQLRGQIVGEAGVLTQETRAGLVRACSLRAAQEGV